MAQKRVHVVRVNSLTRPRNLNRSWPSDPETNPMPDLDPSKPIPPAPELLGSASGDLIATGFDARKTSRGENFWTPPTPEEVARLLPQYQIERFIGRGGMGAVYKGAQLELDRPVAIKLLPTEIAADVQFINRFRREARTLAKLHHPGIVAVHDFGQTPEGHLYFVMEYVDGTDLRSLLKDPGLKPERALELIVQICEALQAAHQQGVIHRDIKPENVLITQDGRIKLADFGLARPLQEETTSRFTATNMVMGTPDYMSPEQRTGLGDHRADIFALGVMLYEMLTGNCPRGAFTPPSRKVAVDVRIDEVVLKAVQEEPNLRYQQVSEMKSAVDRIRTTPLGGIPIQPNTPRLRLYARLIPGALVLGVLIAAVYIFYGDKKSEVIPQNRIEPGVREPTITPTPVEILAPAQVPTPTVKIVETPTITPEPKEKKQPVKVAEALNSASYHAIPPYAPFAPPGAPYRIETTAHDDILEVYVVNNQAGIINVQFAFSNLTGGHTDWAPLGAKNCDPGSRVRLAALYKNGTVPVSYDLSVRWTPGAVIPTSAPIKSNAVLSGSSTPRKAGPAAPGTTKEDTRPGMYHVAPPYAPFVTEGAPCRIESVMDDDCLMIYITNTKYSDVVADYKIGPITGGYLNSAASGSVDCKLGSRVLMAAIFKKGTSPITYDLSTSTYQFTMPVPPSLKNPYPPNGPNQDQNAAPAQTTEIGSSGRAEMKRKLVNIVANIRNLTGQEVELKCYIWALDYQQGRLLGYLCEAPNSGMMLIQGDFTELSAEKRELILMSGKSLVEIRGRVRMGVQRVMIQVTSLTPAN